jgi:hypothetical protein
MPWVRSLEGEVVVRVGVRRCRITSAWSHVTDEMRKRLEKEQEDARESMRRLMITLPVDLEFSEQPPPEPKPAAAPTETSKAPPAAETKKAKKGQK